MSCCNGRRRAARTAGQRIGWPPVPTTPTPTAPETPALAARARLRYVGDRAIVLRGAGSGLTYLADPEAAPSLDVDARDVRALLATGLFDAADG
ncbi:MAG: hypothetical protein R2752_05425 [Vicinamibacterales bacterium]